MGRVISMPFEVNSTTSLIEAWAINNGTPLSITSTSPISGGFSGRVGASAPSSGTISHWRFNISATDGPLYLKGDFNFASFPNVNTGFFGFINAFQSGEIYLKIHTDGTLGVYDNTGTQIGSSSSALSTGVTYRIELKIDKTPAGGSEVVEARINGSAFVNVSNLTIGNQPVGIAVGVNIKSETATSIDYKVDNIALNDTSGSVENSWVGDEQQIVLRPNAAGDSTQWTPSAGNNFAAVDENPPNDDTDYVRNSITLNQSDYYNMGASGLSGKTIKLIQVFWRGRQETSTSNAYRHRTGVKKTTGGTITESADITIGSTSHVTNGNATPLIPSQTLYTDPDGAAWTDSTLDTMQVGLKTSVTSTNRLRVTAVWVVVAYYTPGGTDYTDDEDDNVSATDAVAKLFGLNVGDNVSATDANAKTIGLNKADNASASDVFNRVVEYARTIDDNVSATDANSKAFTGSQSDNASATDATAKNVGKNAADNASATDAQSKSEGKNVADNVSATDSESASTGKNVSDNVSVQGADAAGSPTLIDSYSESNQNTVQTFDASRTGEGQSFTGSGLPIGSAVFYLKKNTGTLTGSANAKIYAHSGTFGTSSVPTGAALATSDNFDVSTLTTSFALVTFTFSGINQITLANATKYVVTIEWGNGSSGNKLDVGIDNSSPTHPGNLSTLFSGSWIAPITADVCFYVYSASSNTYAVSKNIGKNINDNATATDSFSRTVDFLRTFADNVLGTDLAAKLFGKNTADNVTATDNASEQVSKNVDIADNVSATDANSKAVGKNTSESPTATDATSKNITKPFADNVSATDQTSRSYGKSASETVSATDNFIKSITKAIAETILSSETLAFYYQKVVADYVNVFDSVGEVLTEGVEMGGVSVILEDEAGTRVLLAHDNLYLLDDAPSGTINDESSSELKDIETDQKLMDEAGQV